MNIAIVGSREFTDLDAVANYVRDLPADTTIVSGNARGVDRAAETAARHRGLKVISLPAQWNLHGKAAGFIRNKEIVKLADRVVAFWDGVSKGTQSTINLAKLAGKPVEIVRILK